jgi:hypothetical protein
MTTALEPMDKDFEQMMQMLSGFWVTQIAGAVPSYSITDHLAKRSATAQQISAIAGTDKAKIPGVIDNDMFSIFIGWPIEKFHQVRSNIAPPDCMRSAVRRKSSPAGCAEVVDYPFPASYSRIALAMARATR